MSQVNVTINGRKFRMACEDGQEARLTHLAADLYRRIEQLRASFGEIGDTRLTVMAALTVADELADVAGKLHRLETECRPAGYASPPPIAPNDAGDGLGWLTTAAERIEARVLNQTRSDAGVAMG
jgi:cell division protein ZapA